MMVSAATKRAMASAADETEDSVTLPAEGAAPTAQRLDPVRGPPPDHPAGKTAGRTAAPSKQPPDAGGKGAASEPQAARTPPKPPSVQSAARASQAPSRPSPDARRAEVPTGSETLRLPTPTHGRLARELMFQLSLGRTPRSWATACRTLVTSLLEAARRIDLKDLVSSLERFDEGLERAASGTGPSIDADAATALHAAYARLTSHLPDFFPDQAHAEVRRKLLFESVVLRTPELRSRTLAKLHAAGLGTVERLAMASPEQVSKACGFDLEVARELIRRMHQLERERQLPTPAELQLQLERRLRALPRRLTALQAEFESAEREDATERKRAVRQSRDATLLELNQLLAELDECSLIAELERCPINAKIESVERYLRRAQAVSE
jgi:hypothetical protein